MATNVAIPDSIATFTALLKEYVNAADPIETIRQRVGPWTTMLLAKNDPDAGGKTIPFPTIIGGAQGRSNTFLIAQRNATPIQTVTYQLTRVPNYAFTYIDRHTLMASDPSDSAFVKARIAEVEGSRRTLMLALANHLYANGNGNIGQISAGSTVASVTITLAVISTVQFFEANMTVFASPNADMSSPRVNTNSPVITGVNYNTGTLTQAANWSTNIASLAVLDFLGVEGDTTGTSVAGLQAWMTDVAPSATLFFGVDRSQNSRLYGLFFDGSTMNVMEGLTQALGAAVAQSATPSIIYCNPLRFIQLSLLLQSKGMYTGQPDGGYFGFSSITLPSPWGNLKVTPDVQCPYAYSFILNESDWDLVSIGKVPNAEDEGGTILFRNPSADNYEVRNMYYANLGCHAIGWQMKVKHGP